MPSNIVLASASAIRSEILTNAGVPHRAEPARVDEASVKSALMAEGIGPRDLADALAELKALKVSSRHPEALVIGADQTLALGAVMFDKPTSIAEARDHLTELSGKTHHLHSAVVMAEGGSVLSRHVSTVKVTMRPLSQAFIDAYLDEVGETVLASVGAYQLEGLGGQLFLSVDGDYFSVLGLPLLEVLGFLRNRGHLPS